jgi:hypothetical protein
VTTLVVHDIEVHGILFHVSPSDVNPISFEFNWYTIELSAGVALYAVELFQEYFVLLKATTAPPCNDTLPDPKIFNPLKVQLVRFRPYTAQEGNGVAIEAARVVLNAPINGLLDSQLVKVNPFMF